jgi:protein-S-isoprenylcysteine O-methyltransferase Ste14
MLGGIFIMFFGAGALLNSAALFFIVTPVLVIAARIFVRTVEEPELEARLGRDYVEYRRRTPMFFPRFFKP